MTAHRPGSLGASLVEVLTAAAVSALLLALMGGFTGAAMRAWDRSHAQMEKLRSCRNILSVMAADLAAICRSGCRTNLSLFLDSSDNAQPWLAALVTRPGEGPDVCSVKYRILEDKASGQKRLMREWRGPEATFELLLNGADPLSSDAPAIAETICASIVDLRLAPVPGDTSPGCVAFTTNFPEAIEVTLSVADRNGGDAIPLRCRLPLR